MSQFIAPEKEFEPTKASARKSTSVMVASE